VASEVVDPRPFIEGLVADIQHAAGRIAPYVRETPLVESLALSDVTGATVLLKLENLQHTGSFKIRGATNALLALPDVARRQGVVAASSGNHGAAVAFAGHGLGVRVVVFVPEGASPAKTDAMRRYGAEVRVFGTDGLDTELRARAVAAADGMTYVSPYNDRAVVAGQGTIAVELRRQARELDAVVASVGGGGLLGGIAADLKAHLTSIRTIGVLPVNSPVMSTSVRAGRIVDMPTSPTLSDGTAGGIEPDAITFPLCRDLVDVWIDVPESEIASALRHCLTVEHLLVEGAAAVAVAGLLRLGDTIRSARVAVILCGANISVERLRSAL
jgi:threonine dehydratase